MRRHEISDEQWTVIQPLLPGKSGDPQRTTQDDWSFVNAGLWIARTDAHWRDLPERFGPWDTVYKRFNRRRKRGIRGRVLDALKGAMDLSHLLLNFTILRAYQHAAGANGGNIPRLWGDPAVASALKSTAQSTVRTNRSSCT
jgi:putative transposase